MKKITRDEGETPTTANFPAGHPQISSTRCLRPRDRTLAAANIVLNAIVYAYLFRDDLRKSLTCAGVTGFRFSPSNADVVPGRHFVS